MYVLLPVIRLFQSSNLPFWLAGRFEDDFRFVVCFGSVGEWLWLAGNFFSGESSDPELFDEGGR